MRLRIHDDHHARDADHDDDPLTLTFKRNARPRARTKVVSDLGRGSASLLPRGGTIRAACAARPPMAGRGGCPRVLFLPIESLSFPSPTAADDGAARVPREVRTPPKTSPVSRLGTPAPIDSAGQAGGTPLQVGILQVQANTLLTWRFFERVR